MAEKSASSATAVRTQDPDPGPELLPTYTRTRECEPATGAVEHRYALQDSKGREWLWLTVAGSRARLAQHLPLFHERDRVAGSVAVDFARGAGAGAKAITIAIVAAVTSVGQEPAPFLKITQVLWDGKTSAAPTQAGGRASWAFSLAMPERAPASVKSKSSDGARAYPLPPTFTERASPAYIDYRLVATVRRGAFRVNQTLQTSFVFLPISRPAAPSPLRLAAYNEDRPLIGPDGDPDGWEVLAPVKLSGTVFSTRQVELECTLAIAKPLAVATGSPLPLFLTLTSSDQHALDLLAAPAAPRVRLLRVRALGPHALDEEEAGRSDNTFRDHLATAAFWPVEGGPGEHRRTLQGELHVDKSAKPSFVFPNFALRYALVMYPFEAPGFARAGAATEALLRTTVVVTSANAPGVSPRSYTPPGYAPPEGDYNITTGYLENGNQRFLHHPGGHGGFQ